MSPKVNWRYESKNPESKERFKVFPAKQGKTVMKSKVELNMYFVASSNRYSI